MKFWLLFSSFVRQGKKNFKILSLWWIPIFRITRWNPELNNYLPWHRALRVAPLFFTWDYTLRSLQQRLCTASETHIFHKVMCRTFAQTHLYRRDSEYTSTGFKMKILPCDSLNIWICVLRFVSGNVRQQLSVTTKRCNCFRGDRSWENAGLLLGSL